MNTLKHCFMYIYESFHIYTNLFYHPHNADNATYIWLKHHQSVKKAKISILESMSRYVIFVF